MKVVKRISHRPLLHSPGSYHQRRHYNYHYSPRPHPRPPSTHHGSSSSSHNHQQSLSSPASTHSSSGGAGGSGSGEGHSSSNPHANSSNPSSNSTNSSTSLLQTAHSSSPSAVSVPLPSAASPSSQQPTFLSPSTAHPSALGLYSSGSADDVSASSVSGSGDSGRGTRAWQARRKRLKVMLNVAAYGIPKRSSQHPLHAHKTHTSASHHHRAGLSTSAPVAAYPLLNYPLPTRPPHTGSSTSAEPSLAVQVGEDAYFISDLAMGVADGVGGWNRHQAGRTNGSKSNAETDHATPSALFARRLMHFCATEVETTSHLEAPSKPVDAASEHSSKSGPAEMRSPNPEVYYPEGYDEYSVPFASSKPDVSTSTFPNASPSLATTPPPILEAQSSAYEDEDYSDEYEYPYEDHEYGCLDDALDDLSDGIDVLSILERAYEKTLSAHTQRVATAGVNSNATDNTHKEPPVTSEVPLMTGSSTALVAVLDCVKVAPSEDSVKAHDLQAVMEGLNHITITPSPQSAVADVETSTSATSSTITPPSIEITASEPSADNDCSSFVPVIKLAHVGDCTAMLVRGEEIVWRSEEMWWDFNTPAQLGPTSPITPAVLKATVGSSGSASSPSLHERTSVDSEGISSRILESIPPSAWASSSTTSSIPQARPLSPLPAHPTTSPATATTTSNTYSPLSTVHTPAAHLTTLPVQEDDILILASDGMADNLWDAEVLDEVVRFKHAYLAPNPPSTSSAASDSGYESDERPSSTSSSSPEKPRDRMKRRSKSPRSMEESRKLAAQLSEALCSRARRVSERKWNQPSSSPVQPIASPRPVPSFMGGGLNGLRTPPVWHGASYPYSPAASRLLSTSSHSPPPSPPKEAEIPFGRRSKEYGRKWRGGGKSDDISVIVAVISPQ